MKKANGKLVVVTFTFVFALLASAFLTTEGSTSDIDGAAVNPTYEYDASTKTLTLTGGGDGPGVDYNWDCPWSEYSDSAENAVINVDNTSIGRQWFRNFLSLRNVEIKSTGITLIGEQSFHGCCVLTSIELPNSVTSIGDNAFDYCRAMESITLPNALESIGNSAFVNCIALKSIEIPNTVTSIGNGAFSRAGLGTVTVPGGATLGSNVFAQCESLTGIVLPEGITSIPDGLLNGCSAMTEFTIPATVTSVGNSAFARTSLSNIVIPDTVTSIGSRAFSQTPISTIVIPDGITTINQNLFMGCKSLASITIPENVTSIGISAFQGCISLESVTIPSKVTSIGGYAFARCESLTSVTFENASMITKIGYGMFDETGFTSFTVPDSLAEAMNANVPGGNFGEGFLSCCANLSEIDMGKMQIVPESFLNECTALTKVTMDDVVTLGNDSFQGCSSLTELDLSKVKEVRSFALDNSGIIDADFSSAVTIIYGNSDSLSSVKLGNNLKSMSFTKCTVLRHVDVPDSVEYLNFEGSGLVSIKLGSGVRELAYGAFQSCNFLTTADLSRATSLETINEFSFSRCHNLTEVILPEGLKTIKGRAFYKCNITSLDIPESVITLETDAISSPNLETITGGEGLTSIVAGSIVGGKLESIGLTLSNDVYTVTDGVLYKKLSDGKLELVQFPQARSGNFVVPDNVVSYMDGAFGKSQLESLKLSPNAPVANISISDSEVLRELIIPEGVNTLGEETWGSYGPFSNCTALTTVSFPSTLTTLRRGTFNGSGLTELTIPDNVKAIPSSSFSNCENLKTVLLGKNTTEIGDMAFSNCKSLESLDLYNVEKINNSAFWGCSSLKTLVFGEYLKSMDSTFVLCSSLESVSIDGVDLKISSSFNSCGSLKTVSMGAGVTSFSSSFRNCPLLNEIRIDYENDKIVEYKSMVLTADFKKILYVYPDVKRLEIPHSVTSWPSFTNENYANIEVIKMGNGMVLSGGDYVWNFTSLKEFYVSETMTDAPRFMSCPSLRFIDFGNVTTMNLTIDDCPMLEVVRIPATVTQVSSLFADRKYLPVELDEGNTTFVLENKVLYHKDSGILADVFTDRPVLPDGVTTLKRFSGTDMVIGNGITVIPASFTNQARVLAIGSNVDRIYEYAIGSEHLTDIYFMGGLPDNIAKNFIYGNDGGEKVIRVHASFSSGLPECEGITFEYLPPGHRVQFAYDGGVEVLTAAPLMVADNGSLTFSVRGKTGFDISNVTSDMGTMTDDGSGMYTVTGVTGDVNLNVTSKASGHVYAKSIVPGTDSITIGVDDTADITLTIDGGFDAEYDLTWSSSRIGVATVDDKGKVRGISDGTAFITVRSGDAVCTVSVTVVKDRVPVTGVTLDVEMLSLDSNTMYLLTATVEPANATNKDLIWFSDNGSISVDNNGLIRTSGHHCNGTVTVMTADGGFTDTVSVSVNDDFRIQDVSLDRESLLLTMPYGTETLTAHMYPQNFGNWSGVWESSDNDVVMVVEGVLVAVGPGTATVTVSVNEVLTAACRVTVVADGTVEKALVNSEEGGVVTKGTVKTVTAGDRVTVYKQLTVTYPDAPERKVMEYTDTVKGVTVYSKVITEWADKTPASLWGNTEWNLYKEVTVKNVNGSVVVESYLYAYGGYLAYGPPAVEYRCMTVDGTKTMEQSSIMYIPNGSESHKTVDASVGGREYLFNEFDFLISTCETEMGAGVSEIRLNCAPDNGRHSYSWFPDTVVLKMSKALIGKYAEQGIDILVTTGMGTVEIDSDTLNEVLEGATDYVKLNMKRMKPYTLNVEQRSLVGDGTMYWVYMTADITDKPIDVGDASIKLSFIHAARDTGSLGVFSSDGLSNSEMEFAYDEKEYVVSFETTALVPFAVTEISEIGDDTGALVNETNIDKEGEKVVVSIRDGAETAIIPKTAVESIGTGKPVTIGNDHWSVAIPVEAISTVLKPGSDVKISVKDVPKEGLPEDIRGKADRRTFRLDLSHDGTPFTADFGKMVYITVPYTLAEGDKDTGIVVRCISENDGTEYEATYENGSLTFGVPHFSYWTVGYVSEPSEEGGFPLLYIGIVAVLVIAVVGGYILVRKRSTP